MKACTHINPGTVGKGWLGSCSQAGIESGGGFQAALNAADNKEKPRFKKMKNNHVHRLSHLTPLPQRNKIKLTPENRTNHVKRQFQLRCRPVRHNQRQLHLRRGGTWKYFK